MPSSTHQGKHEDYVVPRSVTTPENLDRCIYGGHDRSAAPGDRAVDIFHNSPCQSQEMNTYLVVRQSRAGEWVYAVKVVVPDGMPEPLAFYTDAKTAHADADRLAALKPDWIH
jgi:hypothetical protein